MLRRTFLQGGTLALACLLAGAEYPADPLNIRSGPTIPNEGCRGRPFIVISVDGNSLCERTTRPANHGEVRPFRCYHRHLTTSEAVGTIRAGM